MGTIGTCVAGSRQDWLRTDHDKLVNSFNYVCINYNYLLSVNKYLHSDI